jgi:hypothetical protein
MTGAFTDLTMIEKSSGCSSVFFLKYAWLPYSITYNSLSLSPLSFRTRLTLINIWSLRTRKRENNEKEKHIWGILISRQRLQYWRATPYICMLYYYILMMVKKRLIHFFLSLFPLEKEEKLDQQSSSLMHSVLSPNWFIQSTNDFRKILWHRISLVFDREMQSGTFSMKRNVFIPNTQLKPISKWLVWCKHIRNDVRSHRQFYILS